MIKWLYGLVIKSKKSVREQLADARERLFNDPDPITQQYQEGWAYAAHIWNTSPVSIAKDHLIAKAGEVISPFEIAIYDFLKERNK